MKIYQIKIYGRKSLRLKLRLSRSKIGFSSALALSLACVVFYSSLFFISSSNSSTVMAGSVEKEIPVARVIAIEA